MEFAQELENRTEEANRIIAAYLPKEEGWQKTIFSAMNYAVEAGGKRLRPIFMRETYLMFGGTGAIIEPFMAAIEFIHTYSLIHDDLPAMDNDDYRRGRLTTHKVYGEAMGILAGDALLNYAYETACSAFVREPENSAIGRAMMILAKKAGVYGMVGGQVVDVESEKKPDQVITKDKLDFIYSLKTGALIEASMMIGATLAGASESDVKKTEEIAGMVGMAFQIQDDILDCTGTLEELGKPIGSDEKNEKATFVSLYGLTKAQEEVERLSRESIKILRELPGNHDFMEQLILALINRRK